MESVFCVNCGSAGGSMLLEDEQIRQCIQQWTAPLLVQAHDLICTTCWTSAQEIKKENIEKDNKIDVSINCALCNRTLALRTRSHQLIALRTDTQHNVNIRNIIKERLMPLEIHASHYICHPCWQKSDRAARRYSVSSSSRDTPTKSNQLRCVNCGTNFNRKRRHILHNNAILVQIQQRVAPQVVTVNDYICGACHTLFVNRGTIKSDLQDVPMVGHKHICAVCGCSLARIKSHTVHAENNNHILDVVQNWIQPREINTEDKLPQHLCWECASRLSSANRFIVKALSTQRLLEEVDNSRFIGDIELIDRVQYKLDSTLGTKIHKANEYDYLFIEETVEAKNCNKRVNESENHCGNEHITPTEFVVCKEEPREDITSGKVTIKIEPVDMNEEEDFEPFENATDAVGAVQTNTENVNRKYKEEEGIIIKKEYINDEVTGYGESPSEMFEESQLIDKSSKGYEDTKQCPMWSSYRPLQKNQQMTLNANKKRHKKQVFYKHIAYADQSSKHMVRKMKNKTCRPIKTERLFEDDLDMDMEYLTDPLDTVKVPPSLAPCISNYVNSKGYG